MLKIRELHEKDFLELKKWKSNSQLIKLLGAPLRYFNLNDEVEWYKCFFSNYKNFIRSVIIDDNDDHILALASLAFIDNIDLSAELYIILNNSNNCNSEIGLFAINSMLNHAFNCLYLNRVEVSLLDDNESGLMLYQKCGFIYEGRKRKARYKNGKYNDLLIYSILKSDYSGISAKSYLPTWYFDITNNREEIDFIINDCDKAFDSPITKRKVYLDLLEKVHQNGIFIFAYNGNQYIGYCAFYANNSHSKNAYISLIAVKPEYQKLHIGKALINVCLKIAKSYGMNSCTLEVRKDNPYAIRFYHTNGFFIDDEKESSYLMKRVLS